MKEIIVLGSGCDKCTQAAELIKTLAEECDIQANVIKETSLEVMMQYGVMSTPAVVIDKVLVHTGSIPEKAMIESWLKE